MVKDRKRKHRSESRQGGRAGLPPGISVSADNRKERPVGITLIEYDENTFTEKTSVPVSEAFAVRSGPGVTWLNIDDISDVTAIETLGRQFDIHPLTIEDILHTEERPKAELYDRYIYLVLRMLRYDSQRQAVISEQVSLILGDGRLITFQEHTGDVFEQIRHRLRTGIGRIRRMKADYLAYILIDAIVDSYFSVLEALGDRIENLEDQLLSRPDKSMLVKIHRFKNELMILRRSVWPLRELLASIERGESPLIEPATRVYLRDVYDHTVRIVETLESDFDIVTGMFDIYLSSIGNRTNEIMKVLTMMAGLFIPLSFVAGVFGMNFQHMPELQWRWAYPVGFWVLIGLLTAVMLFYFKKKRWF